MAAGRVVKGVNFVNLRDAGDPVEVARRYDGEGADELAFLDIRASVETRDLLYHMIESVADVVFIPLTVGGGVSSIDDIRALLNAGADKVSINTAGVANPALFEAAARRYGAQCIVAAIDAKQSAPGAWQVYTHGGRTPTGLDAVAWAREVVARGAGEILLTSMDRDGVRTGFDLALTRAVVEAVEVPVIASGVSARSPTWSTASSPAAPMRFSRHRSSTTASSRSGRRRPRWPRRASRCAADASRPAAVRGGGRAAAWGAPARVRRRLLDYPSNRQNTRRLTRRTDLAILAMDWLEQVKWANDGLVAAIAQDAASGRCAHAPRG